VGKENFRWGRKKLVSPRRRAKKKTSLGCQTTSLRRKKGSAKEKRRGKKKKKRRSKSSGRIKIKGGDSMGECNEFGGRGRGEN